MTAEPLAIAQVLPSALESSEPVGRYAGRLSEELRRRGHSVVVIAPTESATLAREGRRAIRAAAESPDELLERAAAEPVTLAVGELLALPAGSRRRAASLPVDAARTIEEALSALPFDIVHLHDPFAPSASSAALRHSRALNVGTFHDLSERELRAQLTRPLGRFLFGRLDARTVAGAADRELMARFFAGEYEVVLPGPSRPTGPADSLAGSPAEGAGPEIVFVATEERAALRTFIRALRQLDDELPWRARVHSPRPIAPPATLSRRLRERIRFTDAQSGDPAELPGGADIVVLASEGARPRPGVLIDAVALGAVPVASRLAGYEELLADGERGLVFEPGDAETLAAQLRRLVTEPELRQSLTRAADGLRAELTWSRVADRYEEIYGRLERRRHHRRADPALGERLRERPLIDVDLHMHTDHSYDCATPVEVLLAEARARGLGAIAITDHNEISGALEAAAKAEGIKVIVGEEVKTADQGEVIGLFLTERIPRGMTLSETIADIRRQGGVVYVPHPFDRLHSVPDYEHLLAVLDQIDAIEVFNPRVAISEFNEEAVRFAAKYRIPAGAGSDAHVTQGLGSVRIRMRDFDGPQEFLQSLREADIVRNPASLLFVQALKFLQTKALPEGARRSVRDRRVRRAARKS